MSAAGAVLFAQYAYPPNELGHCGPPGSEAMLRGDQVRELEDRARQFEGAWSYLEALADATGVADPLEERLVEAYWVGNDLLDSVDPAVLVAHLEERFRGQLGGTWRYASDRARAHHGFQVYEVYPWAALLKAGRPPGPAVRVLDDCRIRVGAVRRVEGETVEVTDHRLVWFDDVLMLGPEVTETARWRVDGAGLIDAPSAGDLVALHWDWVCAVVTPAQAETIEELDHSARLAAGLG